MYISLKQSSKLLHDCVRGICETCPYNDDRETLACIEKLMSDVENKINLVIVQVEYLQREVNNP